MHAIMFFLIAELTSEGCKKLGSHTLNRELATILGIVY